MIDGEMTLVIVLVTHGLQHDVAQENHPAQNVQSMNQGQGERHPVDLGRAVGLGEVMCQQIVHAERLDDHEDYCREPRPD